jgi:hypothetical protein
LPRPIKLQLIWLLAGPFLGWIGLSFELMFLRVNPIYSLLIGIVVFPITLAVGLPIAASTFLLDTIASDHGCRQPFRGVVTAALGGCLSLLVLSFLPVSQILANGPAGVLNLIPGAFAGFICSRSASGS